MAPEVACKKLYSKSVDIWSIGIIMYIVLTSGKHPIYKKDIDTEETYKKKLGMMKKVKADSCFSKIAENLFDKLVSIQASHRYTAEDALKHPWISRKL
jgi:serine/threonine protein kinase